MIAKRIRILSLIGSGPAAKPHHVRIIIIKCFLQEVLIAIKAITDYGLIS